MADAVETEGAEAPPPAGETLSPRWPLWLSNFALGGAILVVIYALGGLTLARYDMIAKIDGFRAFMQTMIPAAVVGGVAILAIVFAVWRKSAGKVKAGIAVVLSATLLLVMYTQVMLPAGKVPPIHDISTDLGDMPQFTALDVDNPVSTGPFSEEEWRAFHEGAYSDIGPIVIDKAPAAVLADAQALAEARGWEIAGYDAEAGRLEATATAGYLRFYDDVVVEVTPVTDGSTRVDMRSVSRVGVSDLGYNAARIREFLADLQAA
ncbi:DUF1499 domain-containing protein [Aurantiacibacter gilvus]|uniref:DUF1499 domain-containing protein n=1 Tax=Aurantiacibacter gilvus TaxID=3139141 RepID=A0ABU9IEI8_9SPHN